MKKAILIVASVLSMMSMTGEASAQYYGAPGYRPGPDYGARPGYGGRGQICATEGEFCAFSGTANVRYGAAGRYVVRRARNGIPCDNRVFGDPAPGISKRCFIN